MARLRPVGMLGGAGVIWVLLQLHINPSWTGIVIVMGPAVVAVEEMWRWNRRTGCTH